MAWPIALCDGYLLHAIGEEVETIARLLTTPKCPWLRVKRQEWDTLCKIIDNVNAYDCALHKVH
jgi:hypothetical protein